MSAARFGVLQAVPIAGTDRDLIIGDNGQILWTTGLARDLFQTSDTTAATGAADTIEGNEDADVIAAGVGGDIVDAGEGNNVVFGDHGLVDWTPTGPGTAVISRIESTELSNGGVDIIAAGGGTDVVIGGVGGDQITVGDGRKILLGDSGRIDGAPAAGLTFGGLALTLGRVSSLAPAVGGDDSILAGAGDKIVFGGVGADTITIAGGSNVVLGDNGFLSEIAGLEIDSIVPTDPTIGAGDTITISGNGNNIVIGAAGKDTIATGEGGDMMFGDFGRARRLDPADARAAGRDRRPSRTPRSSPSPATAATTTSCSPAAAATSWSAARATTRSRRSAATTTSIGGHNVAGGHDGGDLIDGGAGNDVIAGDNAMIVPTEHFVSQRVCALAGPRSTTVVNADGSITYVPNIAASPTVDPRHGSSERTITLFDVGTPRRPASGAATTSPAARTTT